MEEFGEIMLDSEDEVKVGVGQLVLEGGTAVVFGLIGDTAKLDGACS